MRRQFMLSIVFVFASMFLLIGSAEVADAQVCTISTTPPHVNVVKVNSTFSDEVIGPGPPGREIAAGIAILTDGNFRILEGHNKNVLPDAKPGAPTNLHPGAPASRTSSVVITTGSPDCMVFNGVRYCW